MYIIFIIHNDEFIVETFMVMLLTIVLMLILLDK